MLRKLLASFCISAFVLSFVSFMFVFGTYKTFSDDSFYSDNFYELYNEFLIEKINDYVFENTDFGLNREELEDFVSTSISKDDLRFLFDDVVNQLFNTDLKNTDKLHVKIRISEIFENNPEFYSNLSNLLYDHLILCEDNEGHLDKNGKFICIPDDFSDVDLAANVKSIVDYEILSDIPDEFIYDLPFKIDGTFSDFLMEMYSAFFFFSLSALTILLFIIALLIFSPVYLVIMWIAKAFFFSSLSLSVLLVSILSLPSLLFPSQKDIIILYDVTLGVVANYLLYSFAIPIFVLSVLIWFLMGHNKHKE